MTLATLPAPSSAESLLDRFRALRTLGDLADLAGALDRSDPLAAALGFYADEYIADATACDEQPFDPDALVSPDLSAARHRGRPVIFLGTNGWAPLRFADATELAGRVCPLLGPVERLAAGLRGRTQLCIVPEKDTLIEKLFFANRHQAELDGAISHLAETVRCHGVTTGFDSFLRALPPSVAPGDYAYADSHLLSRDYLRIFVDTMEAFGLSREIDLSGLSLSPGEIYADLVPKFPDLPEGPVPFLLPTSEADAAVIEDGMETLATPLGETWQRIRNPKAPIRAHVAIYGDSHSSILSARKLTWFFAQAFERTSFFWNPLRLRREEPAEAADFTVLEISQRFVFGQKPEAVLAPRATGQRRGDAPKTERKRLILHVGFPKCASTSLQSALMRAPGIRYPVSGRHDTEHVGLALSLKGLDTWTAQFLSEEWVARERAWLDAELAAFPPDAGVTALSSERLIDLEDDEIARLLAMLGDYDVEVLVLRRQLEAYLRSVWGHLVYRNDHCERWESFLERAGGISMDTPVERWAAHCPVTCIEMGEPGWTEALDRLFCTELDLRRENVGISHAGARRLQEIHEDVGADAYRAFFTEERKRAFAQMFAGAS